MLLFSVWPSISNPQNISPKLVLNCLKVFNHHKFLPGLNWLSFWESMKQFNLSKLNLKFSNFLCLRTYLRTFQVNSRNNNFWKKKHHCLFYFLCAYPCVCCQLYIKECGTLIPVNLVKVGENFHLNIRFSFMMVKTRTWLSEIVTFFFVVVTLQERKKNFI